MLSFDELSTFSFEMDDSYQEQDQDGENHIDNGQLGNPTPPPDVDLDQLRGDRIGDTVYSGKWCIQTVMKLLQSDVVIKSGATDDIEEQSEIVDMEEELQNEIGALWDMTINVEVCIYLHSVGAVESICYIITNSRCPRATEMCVGMLANIITHNELWKILHAESTVFNNLIHLMMNVDQPVLLEVTRFFNTALCHAENVQCYNCLCENSILVTQELIRILSGSTNVDLLKQSAELTFTLMTLDEREICFCALFADVEFISSILEASKELGCENETSGQNYIMEVFHYFTTYEAGVLAIENKLEQIAETSTTYLKILCQSLNLSNNANIITTIIAILNHIFCRHMDVRIGLMSSPSFIHSVLKTLVAVYRKLGSIAYPKGQNTKKSSAWKMYEGLPIQVKAAETGSWSERANIAQSAFTSFKTPDVSPGQVQQNRELENSWSERRMSSPLVDDVAEQSWKRPKDKKRIKRMEDVRDIGNCESNIEKKEMDMIFNNREIQNATSNLESDRSKDSTIKSAKSALDEQSYRLDLTKSENDNTCAKDIIIDSVKEFGLISQELFKIKYSEVTDGDGIIETDVIKGDESEMSKQAKECSLRASRSNDGIVASVVECIGDKNENHSKVMDIVHFNVYSTVRPWDKTEYLKTVGDGSYENSCIINNTENTDDGCDDAKEDMTKNSDGLNGDKYFKLLTVITEFLTDYFNNLRETITRQDGTPCIRDVMGYLNKQCSNVEIRAIVRCLETGTKVTQPLGRLLHMCDHFKLKHLKSLLLDFSENLHENC